MFGKKIVVLFGILVLLLAACQPVSVAEAQVQLCADLVQFKVATSAVAALTADSTAEEAEAALQAVDDAWEDVSNSAYHVADAEYEALEQSYEDLDDALRDIDEGDTLGDASASVQDEVANISAAYDAFYDLGCAAVE
jgi:hypothetical protein